MRGMRGMWRWWKDEGGGDTWLARDEVRLGEWIDVEVVHYERDGIQPPFWNLPLQEDYVAQALIDPIAEDYTRTDSMVLPMIVGAIILGGALVAVLLMMDVIRFGILS